MGIKRLGRKRLAAIEKLGILKDISASDAMKNAIVSATQHRQGQKVTTDTVLDLGSSTAGLLSKANPAVNGGVGLTVASSSGRAEICQITDDVFGVVTSIETICLEAITDGTLADFDLKLGDSSGGTLGAQPGSPALVKANIGTLGQHETEAYDSPTSTRNKYLFLTSGAVTSQKATATIDCTDAVGDNLVSGITRIRLSKTDGTTVDVVADSSKAKSATASGFFGIDSSVTDAATLAESLANGIGATNGGSGNFTAAVVESTKVKVTQHSTTVTNNGTNFLVDDPQKASGIVVPSFTGGIDDGVAMSGKLLIRVTGFVEFDDL